MSTLEPSTGIYSGDERPKVTLESSTGNSGYVESSNAALKRSTGVCCVLEPSIGICAGNELFKTALGRSTGNNGDLEKFRAILERSTDSSQVKHLEPILETSHVDSNGNDCNDGISPNINTVSKVGKCSFISPKFHCNNIDKNLATNVTSVESVQYQNDTSHISNYYISGDDLVKYSDQSLTTTTKQSESDTSNSNSNSSSDSQDYIDKYLDSDTSSSVSSDEAMTSLESDVRTVIYESTSSREVRSMNDDFKDENKNEGAKRSGKTTCVLS